MKAPKDYSLERAYNDIIYLGMRQKALEESLEEWTEFITTELFKHEISKEHKTYFLNRIREKIKELEENNKGLTKYLYEKIEELTASRKGKHYKYDK